jgi:hypothetical protein
MNEPENQNQANEAPQSQAATPPATDAGGARTAGEAQAAAAGAEGGSSVPEAPAGSPPAESAA